MPQPTSPAYMVAFNVTKNKGTPDEYNEVETCSMTEAGLWLEWLPGDNKWVQIPVICTEAIQGKYFRVADIQSAVATTFHALKGKYIKVFKATVDSSTDDDSQRPKIDVNPDRGFHDKDSPRPLSGTDKVSVGYYFLCDPAPYPEQYKYTLYCPAKRAKHQLGINKNEQYVHVLKRHFLSSSYNLQNLTFAGIPDALLAKVRIAHYGNSVTEADIDAYIQDPGTDTLGSDMDYWDYWASDMQMIWENSIQASPYIWVARIFHADTLWDTLPTLTINGQAYYPKTYDDSTNVGNTAYGDSRAGSSPTPKRIRTGATGNQ